MKKTIVLTLILSLSFNLKSQDIDANFYQTWYLSELYPDDGYLEPFFVNEISPTISPYITFTEDLNLSGVGACNSFAGIFYFEEFHSFIYTTEFSNTDNNCENESQTNFENAFFLTIQYGGLHIIEITEVDNGLKLYMGTAPFGYAIFYNFPLSTSELNYENIEVTVFPNPSSRFIKVKSNIVINSIEIIDLNGGVIKDIQSEFENIDIKELKQGVYLLKIETEKGDLIRKIVKSKN